MSKDPFTDDQIQLARIAKALGHPVRIAILQMLASQSCCYHGDMSEVIPVAKSTLSQHLNELKEAGLIQGEFTPPTVRYCINQENWAAARALLGGFIDHVARLSHAGDPRGDGHDEKQLNYSKMKILILCTGNSCRSQMAQAFLQSFDTRLEVRSAGTNPAPEVHPLAVKVMEEVGLDISSHRPTKVDAYIHEAWDYVITVCGDANENCPVFTGKVKKRLHIGFEDPAKVTGSDEFVLSEFRRIRDEIKEGFTQFYQQENQ